VGSHFLDDKCADNVLTMMTYSTILVPVINFTLFISIATVYLVFVSTDNYLLCKCGPTQPAKMFSPIFVSMSPISGW
jgi:hypothetical protein